MNNVFNLNDKFKNEMIENRRYLHKNPELGFELHLTTKFVMEKLKDMGLDPKKIGKAGITATIGTGGKTILLRGDMDALPTKENTNLEYKSCNEYAHLCGHDMHTTILLGTAKILKENEDKLRGTVKLMFQPAEEIGQGAKDMIEAGILENPHVDAAMALHMNASEKPGKIEYKEEIASASMDSWLMEVQGKGGHSSTPHLAVDPLMIVNTIYTSLNSLVGKEVDPFETAVLTIGKMGGGTAANIIPDTAVLEGGVRCFNRDVQAHVVKRVDEIIDTTVKMMRGTYNVQKISTPSMYNNPELCSTMKPFIEEIIGVENLNISEKPLSGTEDFSYITEKVPSMYIWLGGGVEDNAPLHNPNVIFDEEAIPIGASVLANCAIKWLEKNS